ncbi:MAG: hypothetical protein E6J55_12025 [Deltaproteobacteria bacterium]|nr:MAG: hypothetical protein E6J55_12025 [Deltaproteobacteria bacterium]
MSRIFLLSPAHCGGVRARLVLAEDAQSDLARRLRSREGVPLGEVMTFMSGLYFRGKLAYARAFAQPPGRAEGTLVITPGKGLRPADERVTLDALRRIAEVGVDAANPAYRSPLEASARTLAAHISRRCDVVLLGSVASNKYTDVLSGAFGTRLVFPADFVGRGDMSRGGLLLRCVAEGRELAYVPVEGAVRHGPRPPRLGRMAR